MFPLSIKAPCPTVYTTSGNGHRPKEILLRTAVLIINPQAVNRCKNLFSRSFFCLPVQKKVSTTAAVPLRTGDERNIYAKSKARLSDSDSRGVKAPEPGVSNRKVPASGNQNNQRVHRCKEVRRILQPEATPCAPPVRTATGVPSPPPYTSRRTDNPAGPNNKTFRPRLRLQHARYSSSCTAQRPSRFRRVSTLPKADRQATTGLFSSASLQTSVKHNAHPLPVRGKGHAKFFF